MSGLKNKDFLSLNRLKKRTSGFQILNSLQSSSPLRMTSSIFDLKLDQKLVDESKKLRSRLESMDDVAGSRSNGSRDGRDTFSKRLLADQLNEAPAMQFVVKLIEYNGIKVTSGDNISGGQILTINISSNGKYIFFCRNGVPIKGLAYRIETQLKNITFSILKRSMLIELSNDKGYVYLTYLTSDEDFKQYLKSHWKRLETGNEKNEELLARKAAWDAKNKETASSITTRSMPTRITPIDPRSMYGSGSETLTSTPDRRFDLPRTRSVTKVISYAESDVEPEIRRETPLKLNPPLTYEFQDMTKFTIYNSDFKTLYNNDWINDTVIDFFMKYDIDQAIREKKFTKNDIYVLSSFFFNKLMVRPKTKLLEGETVDYYGNIKNWLNRVDLMSFPYVIIPINENLHWYCCLIKGLPQLLSNALKLKEEMKVMDGFTFNSSSTGSDDTEDLKVLKDVNKVEIFVFDSLSQKHSNIHFPLKKFIIDYCKDKYNVDIPKDRFRVVNARVPKQNNFNDCGIHVIFNVRKWLSDCDECERLWKSGNSMARFQSKKFFNASERNVMRKTLRDTILKLHKEDNKYEVNGDEEEEEDIEIIEIQQTPDPPSHEGRESPKRKLEDDLYVTNGEEVSEYETANGDDDAESDVVSNAPQTSNRENTLVVNVPMSPVEKVTIFNDSFVNEKKPAQSRNIDDDPFTLILKAKVTQMMQFLNQKRTLDPKTTESIINHKAIRRELGFKKLNKLSIDMLNQLYNNEDEIVEKEELTLVGDFIETIRTLRAGVDDESISGELLKFLKCRGKERRHGSTLSLAISTPIRKPMGLSSSPGNSEIRRRPKDTSFTIHHYLDLTDDVLNDSVNGLNITETQKDYRRESLTLKSTPIKAPITSSPRSTFSSPMGNNNERFQSLFKSFPNKRRKLKDEK